MASAQHQAVEPRGPMGVVMGWLIERLNAAQNRATVEALDPAPGASVLEIGFGPGHALEMLSRKAPLALIAGVLKPGGEVVLSIRDFRTEGRFEPAGKGQATAREAEPILESLGFEVATTGVLHSPKRATYLVRGRRR